MKQRAIARVALLILGVVTTPHAHGEEAGASAPAKIESAQALEARALDAMKLNDWEYARQAWLRALALNPSPSTAAYLGRCELELRRYRDAAEHFEIALRTLPDTASERARLAAANGLAEAKEKVATVIATTNRSGAELRVDSKQVGSAPLARPLFIEPGHHEITAQLGSNSITRPVELTAGQQVELSLPLMGLPSAQPKSAPASEQGQPPTQGAPLALDGASRSPLPVLVGGAVFVAGLATGIVFRLNSQSQFDNAEAIRARHGNSGCAGINAISDDCAALAAAAASADRSRNLSTAGFGVAGVALLGTLAYWYWPWRSENAPSAARIDVQVRPSLSERNSGLTLSVRY